MKNWKKFYASTQFVCAATAIGVATSNIQDCPWWLLLAVIAAGTFFVYNGIDALKED